MPYQTPYRVSAGLKKTLIIKKSSCADQAIVFRLKKYNEKNKEQGMKKLRVIEKRAKDNPQLQGYISYI